MLDPHHHYFPEADDPAIAPFAAVFLRMMVAHAEFEARSRELQRIAGDEPKKPWAAHDRPKRMRKLIRKRFGEIPELAEITKVLCQATPLCDDRNRLAHGIWWRFAPETGVITVATDREEYPEYAPADIHRIAERFKDLEAELWRLQRRIEQLAPGAPMPSHGPASGGL
jgi:hypothetical protein